MADIQVSHILLLILTFS